MKKPLYRLFILLCLITLGGQMQAQMIKEVHANRNDYFLDITTILQYSNNKDYLAKGEALLEQFGGVWESGYFKDHHRNKIYEISNTMLKKGMRSYPHFYDFVSCMVYFVRTKQSDESFELWLVELDTLGTTRTSKPIADFLEYSLNLFEKNTLLESRSRSWYFRNASFSFGYDSLLFIEFPELDLVCSTRKDSSVVEGTSGKYYINKEFFIGKEGRVSWKRAGFEEDEVYAEIRSYEVDLNSLSFSSDSSVLYNKKYFDFPIPGVFTEKVLSSPPGDRASYPQFDSYFKDYEVLGMYENVNFYGGIGMRGRTIVFTGEGNQPARFIFKKGGEYFAVVRSLVFELEDDEVVAAPASFSIYFDQDSIYHPGLQMRYDDKVRVLSLIRLNRGIAQSPFFDDYHKVDMYSEALYWVMDSEEVSFEQIRGISQTSKVEFESDRYYSEYEYYKLQGIDEVHPILQVKKYADRYTSDVVKVGAFSDFIDKPQEQAVSMLLMLESRGLVAYNSDKREAIIKNRLYDYLYAHHKETDYDVIQFDSETTEKRNAVVELATFDMLISGVPEISLSDSQGVYIYPYHEEIILRKNKDFLFSGRIRAGLFEFYARDCIFHYDTFMISMPQIDSMSFFVKIPDTSGAMREPRYFRVQAVVENMNGYMIIDDKGNKSGLKTYPQYPIFTSTDQSYVYWDKKTDGNGTYDRSNFYYELEPFTIDSLDNFSTTGMNFNGYLASNGIMPPIVKPLKVMPDYSLGFETITADEGLELYEGKATFHDTVVMDNSGLHGTGELSYLSTNTRSSRIDFFADSTVSTTESFSIEEKLDTIEYADVKVGKAQQIWYPDSNLMEVYMIDEPFALYDSTALLEGMVAVKPDGLKGAGEFTFERAVIESADFNFGHHSMWADTSDFSLYTDTSFSTLAFFTNDFRTDLDFDQRKGRFISTGVSSLIDIPFNQFICYMDEIDWDMDGQVMKLRNNIAEEIPDIDNMSMSELIDLDLKGSDFISTHPHQDSLRFFGTAASYDLQKNIIYAEDVKIIRVADAAVFPGDGKLNILADAQIETLKYADIITDTATRFHHIYNANVDIFTRHQYIAKGDIDYIDVLREATPIHLSSIIVDSLGRTFAFGHVSDSLQFKLSPWYSFRGQVKLRSWQEFMEFDGSFSVIQDCFDTYEDRAVMDTIIDPNDIIIPVPDSIVSPDGDQVMAALMFSPGTERFYPSFFTRPRREGDIAALNSAGLMTYDMEEESFTITDPGSATPDYLSVHNNNCTMEGLGAIELELFLPHVKLDLYGKATHYIIPDSTRFDLVMGFDFFFDDNVMRRMTRKISETNLPGTETNDPVFQEFLRQRIPEGEAEKIMADLTNFGTIRKLPEGINYMFFLNKVRFRWNRSTSSLVSYGDIGVFSIGDEVVNRSVPGYVEIERKGSAYGVINVYFELDDGNWYFFSYRNYIMQAISSDEGFNNEILNLKEENRIIHSRDEDTPYEFVVSSRRKMVDFKRKMEEIK